MDSATLALWGVGVLWVLFAVWCWISYQYMENATKIHSLLRELHDMDADQAKNLKSRQDAMQVLYDSQLRGLEQRTAGVEAMLVSTVGQETQDFCRAMDALMERMEEPEAKQEPAQKPKEKEKLTLSKEHVGRFAKKEAKHGNS